MIVGFSFHVTQFPVKTGTLHADQSNLNVSLTFTYPMPQKVGLFGGPIFALPRPIDSALQRRGRSGHL